jgi:hypothetical protein
VVLVGTMALSNSISELKLGWCREYVITPQFYSTAQSWTEIFHQS